MAEEDKIDVFVVEIGSTADFHLLEPIVNKVKGTKLVEGYGGQTREIWTLNKAKLEQVKAKLAKTHISRIICIVSMSREDYNCGIARPGRGCVISQNFV